MTTYMLRFFDLLPVDSALAFFLFETASSFLAGKAIATRSIYIDIIKLACILLPSFSIKL